MARTVQEIQDEIIAAVQADPNLAGLTSVSAVAIWRLFTRVMATALETNEQLWDVFQAELEQIAREAVPGTADWLQKRVLEFQYDAGSPQVVQVIDGKATYPVINEALRIITRAAVKENASGRTIVKVAKDDGAGGLEPLTAAEKLALEGYLDNIGFIGIPVDVVSQQADRVRMSGLTVYYFRQYAEATVKAAIIDAIDTYLQNISVTEFDGIITRAEIIDEVQAVEGVAAVADVLALPIIRQFNDPVPGGLTILIQRETFAGYAISEDTPGFTLDDTITMLPNDQIPSL